MATGRLGFANLVKNTLTTIYTVPALKFASFSVNFCNRSGYNSSIKLALATADTPVDGEWVLHEFELPASATFERTGLVLEAGAKIVVSASTDDVNIVAYGFEQDSN